MACKYYYNGKEFTESELKAAMLAGEFDRDAKNMGIDIPSMKVVSGPSIRSKEQLSETDRINTALVNAIENNPSKLEEVLRSVYEDAGYHSGTLQGKSDYAERTYQGDMPFTGYYYISNPINAIYGYRSDSGNKLRITDFSKYNLLKPSTNQYWAMKFGIKELTKRMKQGDSYQDALSDMSVDKWSNVFKNFFPTFLNDLKRLDGDKLFNEYKNATSAKEYKVDRFETMLLKGLGYEGVDVRGLKEENGDASPDKFSEGSVIFDLKENTSTSIPEAYQKAKEDGSNPTLINAVDELVQEAPSVQSKEQTTGRVTPNLSNIQGAVNATIASLPNVNIQIDGNRFNQLLSDPESVRITDASGNVVAIVNNGEVVVDPVATTNDDASITSLGYVWMELAKGKDSAVYKQMIEAVKGTQYETDAKQADADMQAQGFPAMSEEQILQRAAAEAIKDRANAYNDRTFGQKIRDAIKKFGEFLNKVFGMSKNYDFLEMTIKDYADIAGKSLMGSKPISTVSNLDLQDIINNGPFISVPGGLLGAKQGWMDKAVSKMGKTRVFKTMVPRNFSNAKSMLKFWFSTAYQKKIADMNIERANLIERDMRQIRDNVFNFRNSFKDFTKDMTDAEKDALIKNISEFLGGKAAPKGPSLSTGANIMSMTIADLKALYPTATELMNTVETMRASIDALSKQIQDTIDPTSEMYGIIDGNMGIYLNRGYAAFKDAGWNESMFPKGKNTPLNFEESERSPEMAAIYRQAIDYITSQYNMSPEEADAKLKEYARLSNDQKDPLQEMKGKMGTAVDDMLKRRQDMPPELRAFFGEYTDPVQKFYHTMENMIKYAENKKFLMKLKDIGMNKIFFDKPSLDFNEEIAGTDTYSPMAGLYTTPEIADLLRGTDNSMKIELLRNIASYWKAFKTIGSIKTTIRNFQSNVLIQTANGRLFGNLISFKKGREGGGLSLAVKEMFRSPSEMNNELVALGVINSGISKELNESVSGFVKSIYDDGIQTIKDAESIIDKSKYIVKKTGAVASRVYEAMDNVWRVAGYMSELDDCKKMFPNMPDAEVKKLAAERFRETSVTYDKAPNIVKRLASSPFVGTFTTFASESIRLSITIPRMAIKDITDGFKNNNSVQKRIGITRLLGFSSTGMALTGLGGFVASSIIKSVTGAEPPDEDEERVLYEGAPDYAKNNSRLITGSKPGEIKAFELDFLNPWNLFYKAHNAYTRTDKYDPDKYPVIESAWVLLEPFLGEEGIYVISKQWQNNDNGRGGKIYDEMDPWSKQMSDAIPWAMRNVVPGIATFGYDVYNSVGVDPEYDKGQKTTGELIRSEFLGFKEQKINTLNSFSSKLQGNYTPKITDQLNEINNIEYKYEQAIIKAKGKGDDSIRKEFLKENIENINQANINLWGLQDDVRKYATSLYATGVPGTEISKKIDNSMKYKSLGGVAAFDISSENLIKGKYHVRTLTPEMLEMLGYKNQQEYVEFLNSTLK